MKTILFWSALTLCAETSSYALPPHSEVSSWADLSPSENLVLDHDLKINSLLTLKAGTALQVTEIQNLDTIDVEVFSLRVIDHQAIIPVEMTILDNTYGIEINPEGIADFYVETKDLFSPSYFAPKETP